MKVLQVHNFLRFGGGEDAMFDNTVVLLRQKGEEVITFTKDSKQIAPGMGGKLHAFASGIYSRTSAREIVRLIERVHPDVAHFHNVYPLISGSAIAACRHAGVPVVLSVHSYRLICPIGTLLCHGNVCERCVSGREYWCVINNCRSDLFESTAYALRTAAARILRLFLDNVTLYITPSDFMRRKLVESGWPSDRIMVVPNMVAVPNTQVDPAAGQYVAYAGRISPEKGVQVLLEATRRTGIPLRLAGDPSAMPEIVQNAPPTCIFVGRLSRQQLTRLYQGAAFLVVPSLFYEPFGLVATEAMSLGLPVLATRTGGLPEVVEDGVTGLLVPPGNVEELTEKMALLWNDVELCRHMGRAARNRVAQEFSEEVHYPHLLQAYQRAISSDKKLEHGI